MKVRALGCLLMTVAVAGCSESDTLSEPETLVVPVFGQAPDGGPKNLRTHLSGAEEVPSNSSKAQGQAIFKVNADGTLSYKLIVANIHDVTQAHIHRAAAGANGGIVAWLYPSASPAQLIPGRTQGILGQGVIGDAEVVGSLAADGVAGLLAEIRAGNAYVNVHTLGIPSGEIRGQVD